MGKPESRAQPDGIFPNGLLPNAGPLIRVLDSERWLKAEERTAELIACIQPNQPSEERRNAVADYIQRLIGECYPCQVFTFGSVPLKTYLPDGDIDMTSFSDNQNMKDSWPNQVRDMLEKEEKNENAEFRVKEVQYIQAEVKLIKCMVENIVVDISFNQLGGLCTLCFLEAVDQFLSQNHLFKRSIILIKAWCYYESRILGAHHGLISTYALETLVLYIFHVYNNSFTGPLEVLYRFLEFFSNFDWDNFCVSLWGPVPISSLPDVTAEPPRKDCGELMLSKYFLHACSSIYAVFPGGQENQGQTFISKHFNIIDPLRVNNNLGRSVSKGNFFRIRSAFAFGAKRLARLLDCPKEDLLYAVNQFFMNTWARHGNGNRQDAPGVDLVQLRLTPLDNLRGSEKLKNSSSSENIIQNSSGCATVAEGNCPQRFFHPHNSYPLVSRSLHSQTQKDFVNSSSSVITDHRLRGTNPDKGQGEVKSSHLPNDCRERCPLARTRSSPELTHTFTNSSSHNRRYETPESEITQPTSARHDVGGNNPSSIKHAPHNPSHVASYDLGNNSNSGRQVHLPNSLASGQRNFGGVLPSDIPLIDPSFSNMKFPQGMMPHQLSHYSPGMALTPNSEDAVEHGNDNFSSGESDHGLWPDHHAGCNGGLESDNQNLGSLQSSNSVHSSRLSGQQKLNKERISVENNLVGFNQQDNRVNDVNSDDRITSSRFASAANCDTIRDGLSVKLSKGKHAAQDEDDGRDLYLLAAAGNEVTESGSGYISLPSPRHHLVGHEPQISGSDTMVPMTQVSLESGPHQREIDNSDVRPFAFYDTGPLITMFPFSSIHFVGEDNCLDGSDSGQNLDSCERPNHAGELNSSSSRQTASVSAMFGEHKPDILNSDFKSHWKNLQFGRLCQNPYHELSVFPPSSAIVPPMYMQGCSQWDGPGRPVSSNSNLITQLMGSHSPRYLPMAPSQSMQNRPPNVYQRSFDEIPRYRIGTGTYFPNPKICPKDRHSSGNSGRGVYSHDRSDSGDYREGHWLGNSKSPGTGHNQQNRNQSEQLSSRGDRISGSDSSRGDHCSLNNSYINDWSLHQSQNGPQFSSSNQSGASDMGGYNMYTLPAMNLNGIVASNSGPLMMLYSFDQNNSTYIMPPEHLEFGSLGPMSVSNLSEQTQQNEGNQRATRGQLDAQRFLGGSEQRSSPDQQHSSPHHNQRRH